MTEPKKNEIVMNIVDCPKSAYRENRYLAFGYYGVVDAVIGGGFDNRWSLFYGLGSVGVAIALGEADQRHRWTISNRPQLPAFSSLSSSFTNGSF